MGIFCSCLPNIVSCTFPDFLDAACTFPDIVDAASSWACAGGANFKLISMCGVTNASIFKMRGFKIADILDTTVLTVSLIIYSLSLYPLLV